ncbi:hypothetical protein TI39_contig4131g00007 [Zymoseptoria brevis]|uniref:Uncharacterized protein n=1 Tax=Zymoseptoria brevis TaxID=1047168 RepID=A0A0F4GCU0_9PEZI|nr:hypothetical protein TI39_contig4131g00007 [Zymoseptoria brevis]
MRLLHVFLGTLCLSSSAWAAIESCPLDEPGSAILRWPRQEQLRTPAPIIHHTQLPSTVVARRALVLAPGVYTYIWRDDYTDPFITRVRIQNDSGRPYNLRIIAFEDSVVYCRGVAEWSRGTREWEVDNTGRAQIFIQLLPLQYPGLLGEEGGTTG